MIDNVAIAFAYVVATWRIFSTTSEPNQVAGWVIFLIVISLLLAF